MVLQLHNTLTRQVEPFAPLEDGHVRLYVCGPTVYDDAHIGNARPVVVFDVLDRLLRHLFPQVTYVRNVTDVDDKIIEAARRNDEPIDRLTQRTFDAFRDDMAALGARDPDEQPRATEHIGDMIALVEKLLADGYAYEAQGHVLFHVPAWPDYGGLSGQSREAIEAGARVEVAPYKKDPADFVLWKPAEPGEPGWDSPWGRGRPGWHIECSAMSRAHLGQPFDIHGGGQDLIFPHHENEIAQSVCAHDGAGEPAGRGFARYWVHNGYVLVEGQKMSKSLGNFVTVRDLRGEAAGEAIRLTLLSAHYRQPLDFTRQGLRQYHQVLERWYTALSKAGVAAATGEGPPADVVAALEDDLNLPAAIAAMHEAVTALNKAADPDARARQKARVQAGADLLGVLQHDPEIWLKGSDALPGGLTRDDLERRIAERTAARKAKDFATADRIRDELAALGIVLEDGPNGTTWRIAG